MTRAIVLLVAVCAWTASFASAQDAPREVAGMEDTGTDAAPEVDAVPEPSDMMQACLEQLRDPTSDVGPLCEVWCHAASRPAECAARCEFDSDSDWCGTSVAPGEFTPHLRVGAEGTLATQVRDYSGETLDLTFVVGARVLPTLNIVLRLTGGIGGGASPTDAREGAFVATTRAEVAVESLSYIDDTRRFGILVGGGTGVWLPAPCYADPCSFALPYLSGQVALAILNLVGDPPPSPNDGYAALLVGVNGGLGYSVERRDVLGWVGPTVGIILTMH